jgi:hypothetical protein
MFGFSLAISAICSRSPLDSERVVRFLIVLTNFCSSAAFAVSAADGAERLRVRRFGVSALRI